jgi:hypothetical protein
VPFAASRNKIMIKGSRNGTDDTTNVTRARGPIAAMTHEVGRNPNQQS